MQGIIDRRAALGIVAAGLALMGGLASGADADAKAKKKVKKAKVSLIAGSQIKPDSITGKQVDEASLGLVPLAGQAQTAVLAEKAKTADTAKKADDADKLAGKGPGAFMASTTRYAVDQSGLVPGGGGGTPSQITASCQAGEKAIGGGGAWIIPGTDDPTALNSAPISASMPSPAVPSPDGATGWTVAGRNITGTDRVLRAYAICVPKTP